MACPQACGQRGRTGHWKFYSLFPGLEAIKEHAAWEGFVDQPRKFPVPEELINETKKILSLVAPHVPAISEEHQEQLAAHLAYEANQEKDAKTRENTTKEYQKVPLGRGLNRAAAQANRSFTLWRSSRSATPRSTTTRRRSARRRWTR